jgi:hypothetical protein
VGDYNKRYQFCTERSVCQPVQLFSKEMKYSSHSSRSRPMIRSGSQTIKGFRVDAVAMPTGSDDLIPELITGETWDLHVTIRQSTTGCVAMAH